MTLAGAAGLAIYSEKPILAAVGILDKTKYLEQTAQDYQAIEFVNRRLGGQQTKLRTLVFIRHLYYLDIPYLNGEPSTSFEVDPDRLQTTTAWKAFFQEKGIGYVVRFPEYPASIPEPLTQLEKDGDLVPLAQQDVQEFQGKRIEQLQAIIPVVSLKVKR